jgi:large subunit ribosomal protein L15
MTANKRKKNSRFKGSRSYGHGFRKKPRGAGHRGGRGNAGSGKRADHNKPSIWKNTHYFGKFGFIKKGLKIDIRAVKNGTYIIDLEKAGYNKLLCKGTVSKKYDITCLKASDKAKERIEAAGGKINITETEENAESESAENKE